MDVSEVLASAGAVDLAELVVVGFDAGGSLFVRSSKMTLKDALWISDALQRYVDATIELHTGLPCI